jgi:hypothetical protein
VWFCLVTLATIKGKPTCTDLGCILSNPSDIAERLDQAADAAPEALSAFD